MVSKTLANRDIRAMRASLGLAINTNITNFDSSKSTNSDNLSASSRLSGKANSAKFIEAMASDNWRRPRLPSVDDYDEIKIPKKRKGTSGSDKDAFNLEDAATSDATLGQHLARLPTWVRSSSSPPVMERHGKHAICGAEGVLVNRNDSEHGQLCRIEHHSIIKMADESRVDVLANGPGGRGTITRHVFKLVPVNCCVDHGDECCNCETLPMSRLQRIREANHPARYTPRVDDASLEKQMSILQQRCDVTPLRQASIPSSQASTTGSPIPGIHRRAARLYHDVRARNTVLEDPAVQAIGRFPENVVRPKKNSPEDQAAFQKILGKLNSEAAKASQITGTPGRHEKSGSHDSGVDMDNTSPNSRARADLNFNPRAREFLSVDNTTRGTQVNVQDLFRRVGTGEARLDDASHRPTHSRMSFPPLGPMPMPMEQPLHGATSLIGTTGSMNIFPFGPIPQGPIPQMPIMFSAPPVMAHDLAVPFFPGANMQLPPTNYGQTLPPNQPIGPMIPPLMVAGPTVPMGNPPPPFWPGIPNPVPGYNRTLQPTNLVPLHSGQGISVRPVRKPKTYNTQQQQEYEAWIEYRKQLDPSYAMQCQARQQKRAERTQQQSGGRSSNGGHSRNNSQNEHVEICRPPRENKAIEIVKPHSPPPPPPEKAIA